MSTPAAPAAAGIPRTIEVAGDGTGTLSFALPPGVTIDVESVYAAIDATAAGATTATLTIAEQGGAVIAAKAQTATVDAGVTGSATWALRLGDDTAAAGPSPSALPFEAFADSVGTITTGALTVLPFVHAFGDTLGTFNGFRYFIGADGTYALSLWVAAQDIGVSYNVDVITRASFTATAQAEAVHFQAITGLPNSGGASVFAVTRPFVAGDQIDVRAAQDSGFNARLNLYGGLCQIA